MALLCHPNADPDAVCSAYVFSGILRRAKRGLRCTVAAYQGMSLHSKLLAARLRLKAVEASPRLSGSDIFVLVDTSALRQLGEWGRQVRALKRPVVVLDHHALHPSTLRLNPVLLVDEEARSTCEIVYRVGRSLGYRFSRKEAFALLFGIVYETRHFRIATSSTFEAAARLASLGVNVEAVFSLLTRPMPESERIARLKAAQRLNLNWVGGFVIATSHVSSFEASAAGALVSLGADVAMVGAEKKGEIRISLRSSKEFYEKSKLHLGSDLAFELGEALKGVGGGHATAAGVTTQHAPLEWALREAVNLLKRKLGGESPGKKPIRGEVGGLGL